MGTQTWLDSAPTTLTHTAICARHGQLLKRDSQRIQTLNLSCRTSSLRMMFQTTPWRTSSATCKSTMHARAQARPLGRDPFPQTPYPPEGLRGHAADFGAGDVEPVFRAAAQRPVAATMLFRDLAPQRELLPMPKRQWLATATGRATLASEPVNSRFAHYRTFGPEMARCVDLLAFWARLYALRSLS